MSLGNMCQSLTPVRVGKELPSDLKLRVQSVGLPLETRGRSNTTKRTFQFRLQRHQTPDRSPIVTAIYPGVAIGIGVLRGDFGMAQ
jgi:hypothetical protein